MILRAKRPDSLLAVRRRGKCRSDEVAGLRMPPGIFAPCEVSHSGGCRGNPQSKAEGLAMELIH